MKLATAFAVILAAALPSHAAKPPTTQTATALAAPAQNKDIAKIVTSLEKGKWAKARKKLAKILKENPADSAARTLLTQIDSEPKALLGASSFPYLVRPGDSYQSLAQRHLGNALMFYALARYNGVSEPAKIAVGTTLRIPGVAKANADPKFTEPRATSDKPRQTAKSRKKVVAPAVDKPAASAAKTRTESPALAGALRRQGLSALARGNPRGAVVLLERAAAADPANKLVAADLARARRVRDAVR